MIHNAIDWGAQSQAFWHIKLMVVENENEVDVTAEETTEKRGPSVTAGRPRTRRCVMEEERLRKEVEAKLNEPRRSNRDHDVSSYRYSFMYILYWHDIGSALY